MAFNDGIRSTPIAYIGAVSVIITFVLVLLLQVLFLGQQEALVSAGQAKQGRPAELADLTARQLTRLTRREMVDRDRGIVTIGVSRAMELVVKELAEGRLPADVMGPAVSAGSGIPAATPSADGPSTPTEEASSDSELPSATDPQVEGPEAQPAPDEEQ